MENLMPQLDTDKSKKSDIWQIEWLEPNGSATIYAP